MGKEYYAECECGGKLEYWPRIATDGAEIPRYCCTWCNCVKYPYGLELMKKEKGRIPKANDRNKSTQPSDCN